MPAYKDKNKTWYVTFYYTDWTGKRKKKLKRGFRTKSEAKEYEANFLSSETTNEELSFTGLYNNYINDISGKVRQSTLEHKKGIFEKHILPYFNDIMISDIKAPNIRMWQNVILQQNYQPTYQRSINSQMSAIMNYAVKYYGLSSNPCKIAGIIGKKNADEMDYWTLSEFNMFISVIKDIRTKLAFQLLFWCGIRKGELMALTPSDLSCDSISINKSLSFRKIDGKYQPVVTKPKTDKSKRIVTVPKTLYDELIKYINMLYGITDNDFIFDFGSSHFLNSAMLRYAPKAGVKTIRVHDLRHSHVALCISQGYKITDISARLGHENIETTINTYGHLYPDSQKSIADDLNEIMNK